MTEPLGVVVCIGPFNFPLTTPTFKAAASLILGNAVANGEGSFRRDTHCFGGYKHSGVGREGIMDLMEEFSQRKTIVIRGV